MSHKLNRLWQELKRRKVLRVLTVYAAGAFVILEASDIILPRIGLPDWTVTILIVLLAFGFMVAAVLAWIFDITPDGIRKTRSLSLHPHTTGLGTEWPTDHGKETTDLQPASTHLSFSDVPLLPDRKEQKKGRYYGIGSIVIIAISGILFLFYSGRSVPFYERDWVIIADFNNTTGEELFDKCLNTAFLTSIAQSQYVNVFTRQRLHETLARMQVGNTVVINPDVAREASIREGIDIFLAPAISKVGDNYVLSCDLIEAQSGDLMRSEVVYAEGQSEILEKMDKLSLKIRRSLGETRYQIMGQNKPLARVTTHSLEALQKFSLGIEHHLAGDFGGARRYYESALQIDSTFTSARASLGNLLYEKFNQEEGTRLLNKVIASVNELTDKEKYGILAFYAVNVEKDLNKGIEYNKMLIEMYPDDPTYQNNIGWYYQNAGRYEEALEHYKIAVAINPKLALTYSGIAYVYNEYLGRYDSAYAWSKRMIADNPGNVWGYMHLGTSLVCFDSLEQSARAFEKAMEIVPDIPLNLFRLSHVYRLMGMYEEAIQVLQKILMINPNEAAAHYIIGLNYRMSGDETMAVQHFSTYRKIVEETWTQYWPDDAYTYISLASASFRLGDDSAGNRWQKTAIEKDSTAYLGFSQLYAVRGDLDSALALLNDALENGYRAIYWIILQPDLQPLHDEPEFIRLLNYYGPG
jgi:tetratricopeptide (TPR) repeat protein